jgi:hypothetical protein
MAAAGRHSWLIAMWVILEVGLSLPARADGFRGGVSDVFGGLEAAPNDIAM